MYMEPQQSTTTASTVSNKNGLLVLVGIALILLMCTVAVVVLNQSSNQAVITKDGTLINTISVTGKSERKVKPDKATVSITISETATTSAEATANTNKKVNAIKDILHNNSVSDSDITQQSISVSPRFEGYYQGQATSQSATETQQASQTLEVLFKVGDNANESVAKILDQIVKVNNVSFYVNSFDVSNRDELLGQIRADAIKDARTRAENDARALGVKAGNLIKYSDSANNQIFPMMAVKDMLTTAVKSSGTDTITTLSNAQITLSMSVDVVYSIAR